MRKQDKFGKYREYPFEYEEDEQDHPHEDENIICDCGCNKFKVCWWDYLYTGGFCKIICYNCGEELILINAYA